MFTLTFFLRCTLTYRSCVGRSVARSLPLLRSFPSTARVAYRPQPPPPSIHGQHHRHPYGYLSPPAASSRSPQPRFSPHKSHIPPEVKCRIFVLRWICGERRHGAGASSVCGSRASTSTSPSSVKAAAADLGGTMSLLSTLLESRAGSAP
jgi:hypothetical protein